MSISPNTPNVTLGSDGSNVNVANPINNPNWNSLDNYLQTQRAFYERTIGGAGWTEDQIANAAIRSRHIRPQKNIIQMTNNGFTLGNSFKTAQQIQVVTEFPNANVDLYLQQAFEATGPAGDYLIGAVMERSSTSVFTASTLIAGNQEKFYFVTSGPNSQFRYLKFRIIDLVPTAGVWYYRLKVILASINNASFAGEPISILGANASGNNFDKSNYIIYDISNGFTV